MNKYFASLLGIIAFAAVGLPSALAADGGTGFYVGGNVGAARAKIDDGGINAALLSLGATSVATTKSENSTGYKVFAGYQFNRNFSIEGGYFNLGKISFDSTTAPAGTLHGDAKNQGGLNLDAVGTLPINENFSAFGRIGVQNAETKLSLSGTGAIVVLIPEFTKRETNVKFGLGLQFDFNKNIGMRGEWERYRVSDGFSGKADIDLFSLGMVVRF
ncbi:MAG: porin family protein [Betaproteobacteria bacterium]|nr:porin family protein [Betaproteobacteria bacterium]